MSESALILRDDKSLSISFTEAANELKEAALSEAALIGKVIDAPTNSAAAEAQRKLADLRKTVERARVICKAPVIEFGKDIDNKAKEFIAEITAEEIRITKLCGDFFALQEQRRKAAEEVARLEAEAIENARRAEEQRIHREAVEREAIERRKQEALEAKSRVDAAEAQRKIQEAKAEAERASKAAVEAAKPAPKQSLNAVPNTVATPTLPVVDVESANRKVAELEAAAAKQREQAERDAIELKRQQELAAANTHAQLDAAQERASNAQAAVVVNAPAQVRAAGQRVVDDYEIVVNDIYLLAKVHPGLVKMEARIGDIKAAVKTGAKIAGITATPIVKASVRGNPQPRAIDI